MDQKMSGFTVCCGFWNIIVPGVLGGCFSHVHDPFAVLRGSSTPSPGGFDLYTGSALGLQLLAVPVDGGQIDVDFGLGVNGARPAGRGTVWRIGKN